MASEGEEEILRVADTALGREDGPPVKIPSKLDIHVVESHNDALVHHYGAVGRGHLPSPEARSVTMVHFDAHPDLLVPDDDSLDAADSGLRDRVYSAASIAEWILPLAHAGPLDHVVWLKPPWATQIPDGSHTVLVGACAEGVPGRRAGALAVSSPLDYYTDEGALSPEQLVDPVPVRVDVVTVAPAAALANPRPAFFVACTPDPGRQDPAVSAEDETTSAEAFLGRVRDARASVGAGQSSDPAPDRSILPVPVSRHVILDVCLDFFTTTNPWRPAAVTAEAHATLRRAYFPDLRCAEGAGPGDAREVSSAKEAYTELLREGVAADEDPSRWVGTEPDSFLDDPRIARAASMWRVLADGRRALTSLHALVSQDGFSQHFDGDFHESACLSDLPHAPAPGQVVDALLEAAASIINQCPEPAVVTIARSVDDGYTPPAQANSIEDTVVEIVRQAFHRPVRVRRYGLARRSTPQSSGGEASKEEVSKVS